MYRSGIVAVPMLLTLLAPRFANGQVSRVENNTFISAENPAMRVSVDRQFKYLGQFPFAIGSEVQGRIYIFAEATPAKKIQRMFVIQQEGFLPSSSDTYKYRITTPATLGKADYQHSVIFENNADVIREEPGKEADLTERFLAAKGYLLDSELVMTRFARPADEAHKHEIIFFCFENLSAYKRKLADFSDGVDSPEKQEFKRKADDNCRGSFHVTD